MPDLNQLLIFFLVFLRAAAFLISGPLLAVKGIPVQVKVALAFILSLLVFPGLHAQGVSLPGSSILFILQAAGEVAVGIGLGFTANLILILFRMAGHLIDLQIGFGMSGLFDPSTATQNTVIAHFMYFFSLVIFMTMDGHHSLILALAKSYQLVPLNTASFSGTAADFLIRAFAGTFALSVQVAVPILAVLVITDIALGIIARTAPQMNIFMLGLPFKVLFGLLVLSITIPVMTGAFGSLIRLMENNLLQLMKDLS